ncbi:DinB family protein [Paenibacillus sp. KQZ6P-2]|uniref:DinB family protein n=1 Tax=Paenibacillus mangrovi TaxID=2931978 RepID=A0A9X1WQB7_9BACL|nr:DinB family protein [Paenibacillus mangrovi]MCJ8013119.1 DinB family protein [Paenibacillus mangrovi]
MSIRNLLLQNWDYCMGKEDWYPPLQDALKDVTPEQAVWKPEEGAANSIWENVQHLLYYKERLLGRLQGLPADSNGVSNDDTFRISDDSGEGWEQAKSRLIQAHVSLRSELERLPEEELESNPQRFMSLITHDAYHTGQIIFLRKLQGCWPATRSFD